ncbi:hypothetical protein HanXRQr2_Chr07g0302631 [Helianthus annuus]|uniref:Uncharacterized protein n=1 Tax=Helianthus annuus TaxID=4232 RepID=A0A9K3IMF4_HELAN|nr:hypothetical protein HanXRQr2_Chr07g0302631 [Helianthus annuus]
MNLRMVLAYLFFFWKIAYIPLYGFDIAYLPNPNKQLHISPLLNIFQIIPNLPFQIRKTCPFK